MKLPTNAQIAEINSVTGMNSDVATMTGLTNTRRRKIWTYDTIALSVIRMVSIGTVWRRVVYGRAPLVPFFGLPVTKSTSREKK